MNEQLEVLRIVTSRLNKANIPYMISGSIAANYYTVPRMTRDIDIVVELEKGDIDRFVELFQKDFYTNKEMIESEVLNQGMFNLIHNQHVLKVDFIVRKTTEYNKIAFSRRKNFLIKHDSLWFISPQDLVVSKLSRAKDSRSEMQLRDVRNLIKTVNGLDINYIENWTCRLGLEQIYKEAKNE